MGTRHRAPWSQGQRQARVCCGCGERSHWQAGPKPRPLPTHYGQRSAPQPRSPRLQGGQQSSPAAQAASGAGLLVSESRPSAWHTAMPGAADSHYRDTVYTQHLTATLTSNSTLNTSVCPVTQVRNRGPAGCLSAWCSLSALHCSCWGPAGLQRLGPHCWHMR